jgi:hypothetical protein
VQVHDWLCWPLLLCGFEHFIWTLPMGNLFLNTILYHFSSSRFPPYFMDMLVLCCSENMNYSKCINANCEKNLKIFVSNWTSTQREFTFPQMKVVQICEGNSFPIPNNY